MVTEGLIKVLRGIGHARIKMKITKHGERSYFAGWAGLDLHFNVWWPVSPPKAAAILIHGYAEHHLRYKYIIDRLTESGICVYAYDQRGHGRSEGMRGDVVRFKDLVYDLATLVEYSKEHSPGLKIFLIAHSLGASVAASFGATHPELGGIITTGIYVSDTEGYNPLKKWGYALDSGTPHM